MNRLRFHRTGDGPALNQAFNRVFGQARSLEEWDWKFRPGEDGSRIALWEDENTGEVLAQFAALRVPFRHQGHLLQAGHSVDDFCVRREELVLGKAYEKLMAAFHQEALDRHAFDFLYGFPGERHLRLLQIKGGYEAPVPVPYFEHEPGPDRSVWPLWRLREVSAPPVLDELWQRAAHRYPTAAVRDGAWLRNRYLRHPAAPYRSLGIFQSGRPRAWAVFRPLADQLVWGDLLWDGHPGALRALHREARALCRRLGLPKLSLWLHGDPLAATQLQSLGWRSLPNPLPLAGTSYRYAAELPGNLLASAYFTRGDSDLF